VFQQDPLATPEQRREAIISTLAAALQRWHRDQIRAGARVRRAASIPAGEHPQPESSRLDALMDVWNLRNTGCLNQRQDRCPQRRREFGPLGHNLGDFGSGAITAGNTAGGL